MDYLAKFKTGDRVPCTYVLHGVTGTETKIAGYCNEYKIGIVSLVELMVELHHVRHSWWIQLFQPTRYFAAVEALQELQEHIGSQVMEFTFLRP